MSESLTISSNDVGIAQQDYIDGTAIAQAGKVHSADFSDRLRRRLAVARQAERDATNAVAGVVVEQVGCGAVHMPDCEACGAAMRQRRITRSDTAVTVQFFCDCNPHSSACRERINDSVRRRDRRWDDRNDALRSKGIFAVPGPYDLERRAAADACVDTILADLRSHMRARGARRVFEPSRDQRPDTVPAVA